MLWDQVINPTCYPTHPFFSQVLVYDEYNMQTYMDSEIRAIMAQYMPLDNQSEIEVHGTTRGGV